MLLDLLRFLMSRARSRAGARGLSGSGGPEACNERGIELASAGRHEEALDAFDSALALKPDYPEALVNRGNALEDLQRPRAALASYDLAIGLRPDVAGFHINRGNALRAVGDVPGAIESYSRAAVLDPASAGALYSLGEAQLESGRFEAAVDSFGRAMLVDPGLPNLYGMWLHARMMVCSWDGIEEHFTGLCERLGRSDGVSPPFPLVAMPVGAGLQRRAAETWVRERYAAPPLPEAFEPPSANRRIRIGYFSADFHLHATAHLMARLFELHDRSRFEITAFSFGPVVRDEMRARLVRAIENFVDVSAMSDAEVAMEARRRGIDIAIDLKGYCKDSRTGIFAHRAAPVQAGYLGYPGTMGASFIDYLLADETLIPEALQHHYSEKIVYLPDCYQANDSKRPVAERIPSKEEAGLPSSGFVFCCFNNNFKIVPEVFDCWMRILGQVEGSVLWLLEDSPLAARNLRKEARARGVDPDRLAFARRMALPDHLARHALADLFLDTVPCNAHTTASDALWAGLPVLTCVGETFAGRVAASLLNAVGLPELVTQSLGEYERQAVALARSPVALGSFRERLEANRLVTPLFDTRRFTRNIESAYAAMHARHTDGLRPANMRPGEGGSREQRL